jgi:hypothetical protein
MNEKIETPPCSWCSVTSVMKQGRIFLCEKHYRFQQMRSSAKRKEKLVPSYLELENLLSFLQEMKCPTCKRVMNWRSYQGETTVITLQHDRGGRVRFLCRSCNTRHAVLPGDSFYSASKRKKLCQMCGLTKAKKEFYADRSRTSKLKSQCKVCSDSLVIAWRESSKEKYNGYQRKYRANSTLMLVARQPLP